MAIVVQHCPVYQELPNQKNDLGSEFINLSTWFTGPWQPAGLNDNRVVDTQDTNDEWIF